MHQESLGVVAGNPSVATWQEPAKVPSPRVAADAQLGRELNLAGSAFRAAAFTPRLASIGFQLCRNLVEPWNAQYLLFALTTVTRTTTSGTTMEYGGST